MPTIMKHFFIFLFAFFFIARISFAQQKFGDMDIPVRMTHTFGLSGNLGWNALTGVGITFQYYVIPKVALDAGLGISSVGYKFSGRARYIFMKKAFSPFVSAGFIYGTGSFDQPVSIDDVETSQKIIFKVLPSRYLQFTVGAEYVAKSGFFIMFGGGIAVLLSDNIKYISGSPSETMKRVMDITYGTGLVMEVSIGYIFKNKGYRGKF